MRRSGRANRWRSRTSYATRLRSRNSSVDVRHVMTVNSVYQLPFAKQSNRWLGGWEVAGIASARTGLPVTIGLSRAAGALPDGNTSGQRPNLVPGVSIYADHQDINNWFNPAAFSAPGEWHVGQSAGRLTAVGPGGLRDRFVPAEALPGQRTPAHRARAAAFNLLNHPEYKSPGASVGSVARTAPNLDHQAIGHIRQDYRRSRTPARPGRGLPVASSSCSGPSS